MKLLVGLGNFEKKYDQTRHNIGFVMVEALQKQYGFTEFRHEKKFFGQISTGQVGGEKIILLKPETYMNRSGQSVGALAHFYKIGAQDVVIFYDDIDQEFGAVRFREKGRSGGHNGIKSVIESLGSDVFPRIKFGISNAWRSKTDTADFVLQRFSKEEQAQMPEILKKGLQSFLENVPC